MKTNLKNHLARRKREIERRLERTRFEDTSPVLAGKNIHYEVSERTRAITCGGLGMVHQMVRRLGLAQEIDRSIPLFNEGTQGQALCFVFTDWDKQKTRPDPMHSAIEVRVHGAGKRD